MVVTSAGPGLDEAVNQKPSRPPILLRLNPVVLALLKSGNESVRIQVDGSRADLMIGKEKFLCSNVVDTETIDAFVRTDGKGDEEFRYAGRVSNRIIVEPLAPATNTKSSLTPEEVSVAHCLALGPMRLSQLADRAKLPLATVAKILEHVGSPMSGETFELQPELYRKLRIWDWKPWSPQDRDLAISNAHKAFDRLGYPKEHPARLMLTPPESDKEKINTAPRGVLKLSAPKKRKTANGALSTQSTQSTQSNQKTSSTATKVSTTAKHTNSKNSSDSKLSHSDEDMFNLAKRFRDAYDDYYRLYSVLSDRKTRSPSQVQKLLSIHRELEQWKRTLWENARRRKTVV